MAVEGEGRAITRAHIEALGARHRITAKRIKLIVEEVRASIAGWARFAHAVDVAGSLHTVRSVLESVDRAFG